MDFSKSNKRRSTSRKSLGSKSILDDNTEVDWSTQKCDSQWWKLLDKGDDSMPINYFPVNQAKSSNHLGDEDDYVVETSHISFKIREEYWESETENDLSMDSLPNVSTKIVKSTGLFKTGKKEKLPIEMNVDKETTMTKSFSKLLTNTISFLDKDTTKNKSEFKSPFLKSTTDQNFKVRNTIPENLTLDSLNHTSTSLDASLEKSKTGPKTLFKKNNVQSKSNIFADVISIMDTNDSEMIEEYSKKRDITDINMDYLKQHHPRKMFKRMSMGPRTSTFADALVEIASDSENSGELSIQPNERSVRGAKNLFKINNSQKTETVFRDALSNVDIVPEMIESNVDNLITTSKIDIHEKQQSVKQLFKSRQPRNSLFADAINTFDSNTSNVSDHQTERQSPITAEKDKNDDRKRESLKHHSSPRLSSERVSGIGIESVKLGSQPYSPAINIDSLKQHHPRKMFKRMSMDPRTSTFADALVEIASDFENSGELSIQPNERSVRGAKNLFKINNSQKTETVFRDALSNVDIVPEMIESNVDNLITTSKIDIHEKQQSVKQLFKSRQPRNSLFADAINTFDSNTSNVSDHQTERQSPITAEKDKNDDRKRESLKHRSSLRLSSKRVSGIGIESVKLGSQPYSPASIASETINFDKWKQLASSTILESPKTPFAGNRKRFKQVMTSKLDSPPGMIIEEIENNSKQDRMLAAQNDISQKQIELTQRISSSISSKDPELEPLDLDIINKEILKESKEEKVQRQSIGTWLKSQESGEDSPTSVLSQSEIDRQVIEELKAKRTNPPVRRSTRFEKSVGDSIHNNQDLMAQNISSNVGNINPATITKPSVTNSNSKDFNKQKLSIDLENMNASKNTTLNANDESINFERNKSQDLQNKIDNPKHLENIERSETLYENDHDFSKVAKKNIINKTNQNIEHEHSKSTAKNISGEVLKDLVMPIDQIIEHVENIKKIDKSATKITKDTDKPTDNLEGALLPIAEITEEINKPAAEISVNVDKLTVQNSEDALLPNVEFAEDVSQSDANLENTPIIEIAKETDKSDYKVTENNINIEDAPMCTVEIPKETSKSASIITENLDKSIAINKEDALIHTVEITETVDKSAVKITKNINKSNALNFENTLMATIEIVKEADKAHSKIAENNKSTAMNIEDALIPTIVIAKETNKSDSIITENIDKSTVINIEDVLIPNVDFTERIDISAAKITEIDMDTLEISGEIDEPAVIIAEPIGNNTVVNIEHTVLPSVENSGKMNKPSAKIIVDTCKNSDKIEEIMTPKSLGNIIIPTVEIITDSVKMTGNIKDIVMVTPKNIKETAMPTTDVTDECKNEMIGNAVMSKKEFNHHNDGSKLVIMDDNARHMNKTTDQTALLIEDNNTTVTNNNGVQIKMNTKNIPLPTLTIKGNIEDTVLVNNTKNPDKVLQSSIQIISSTNTENIKFYSEKENNALKQNNLTITENQSLHNTQACTKIVLQQTSHESNSRSIIVGQEDTSTINKSSLKNITSLNNEMSGSLEDQTNRLSYSTNNLTRQNISEKGSYSEQSLSLGQTSMFLFANKTKNSVKNITNVSNTSDDLTINQCKQNKNNSEWSINSDNTSQVHSLPQGTSYSSPQGTFVVEDNSFSTPELHVNPKSKSVFNKENNVVVDPVVQAENEIKMKEIIERIIERNDKVVRKVKEICAKKFSNSIEVAAPYLLINNISHQKQKEKHYHPIQQFNKTKEKLTNLRKNKPAAVTLKPKKLFNKESWITKRLYCFIQKKLKTEYGLFAVQKSEQFIKYLADTVNVVVKNKGTSNYTHVRSLMKEMARLKIVDTNYDFIFFVHEYLPFNFRMKSISAEGRNVKPFPGKLYDPILRA